MLAQVGKAKPQNSGSRNTSSCNIVQAVVPLVVPTADYRLTIIHHPHLDYEDGS